MLRQIFFFLFFCGALDFYYVCALPWILNGEEWTHLSDDDDDGDDISDDDDHILDDEGVNNNSKDDPAWPRQFTPFCGARPSAGIINNLVPLHLCLFLDTLSLFP